VATFVGGCGRDYDGGSRNRGNGDRPTMLEMVVTGEGDGRRRM
jgi:hypothetical protein